MLKKIIVAIILAIGSAGLAAMFGLSIAEVKLAAAAGGFGSLFTFYLLHTAGFLKDNLE